MNTKPFVVCTAVVIALALVLAPIAIGEDAFAGHKKSNKSSQSISQSQSNSQSSQSSSGGSNVLSGNNINIQVQKNSGSNTAGQSNN